MNNDAGTTGSTTAAATDVVVVRPLEDLIEEEVRSTAAAAVDAEFNKSSTTTGNTVVKGLHELMQARQVTNCNPDGLLHWILPIAAQLRHFAAFRYLWRYLTKPGKALYTSNAAIIHSTGTSSDDYFFHCNATAVRLPLHEAVTECDFIVINFLLQEFNFNVNQKDSVGYTPICHAVVAAAVTTTAGGAENDNDNHAKKKITSFLLTSYLLNHGANVNRGGEFGPLYLACRNNNTEVARLLLQHGADPNLNRRRGGWQEKSSLLHRQRLRNTDWAILHANVTLLRLLLQYKARVDGAKNHNQSLEHLLLDVRVTRETKLEICRLLVQHANNNNNSKNGDEEEDAKETAAFLQSSLENAIKGIGDSIETSNDACKILLEAGLINNSNDQQQQKIIMSGRRVLYSAIRAENESLVISLVAKYQVDPFLEEAIPPSDDDAAASPFLAAARLKRTKILHLFLLYWDYRFADNGGKNENGDDPIHVVCCDAHITLPAIQLVVERQVDTVARVDGEKGFLPIHFCAMWNASLDVIYYLLQHCPDALQHYGNGTTTRSTGSTGLAATTAAAGGLHSSSSSTKGKPTTRPVVPSSSRVVETRSASAKQGRPRRRQGGPNDTVGPTKKKAKTNHY